MKLIDLLGIKYPILQGAMAQISREPLVSAVSNAGGLGILASGGLAPSDVETEIHLIKKATKNPFAVNIMLMDKNADDIAELVIKEHVAIVTTGAGTPKKYFEQWKAAGIIVIPVIPTVAIAKKMENLGVDAVIAEGTEAGGHVGLMTSLVLWPQVVRAVSIPVIGAGGIVNAQGFLAAITMGCSGIQMGTRFLVTKECPIGENYKNCIIMAKDDSTIVTGFSRKDLVRALKNEMSLTFQQLENSGASSEELSRLGVGSLRKAAIEDDIIHGSLMAGQAASLINDKPTVSNLITDMVTDVQLLSQSLKVDL